MIPYFTSGLKAPHGFFTRLGGVSAGSYSSLNCGTFGQDDPGHVAENQARAARAIGAEPSGLVLLKQVHGARVVTVTSSWPGTSLIAADALVTDRAAIALGIITADCVPVLFSDPEGRVVGAAHAGWRGALAGVVESTAAAMRRLGATRIDAAVGPCIHQQSYEVGPDLRDAIRARSSDDDRFFIEVDAVHWRFDLPGYVARRLDADGVVVERLAHDTFTDAWRFFSHRRRTKAGEGPGGHQISIIKSNA